MQHMMYGFGDDPNVIVYAPLVIYFNSNVSLLSKWNLAYKFIILVIDQGMTCSLLSEEFSYRVYALAIL